MLNEMLRYMYRYGNVIINLIDLNRVYYFEYLIKLNNEDEIRVFAKIREIGTGDVIDEWEFDIESPDFLQLLFLIFDNYFFAKFKIVFHYLEKQNFKDTTHATNLLFRKIMSVFSSNPNFLTKLIENYDILNSLETWKNYNPKDEINNYSWSKKDLDIIEMMDIIIERINNFFDFSDELLKIRRLLRKSYDKKNYEELESKKNQLLAELYTKYYADKYYLQSTAYAEGLNHEFLDGDNNLSDDAVESNGILRFRISDVKKKI